MKRCKLRSGGRFLVVAVACCGCGELSGAPHASSSTTQARVRGKVIWKGSVLTKAEIHFNPANVYRRSAPTATAPLGADGSYEVTTFVGENLVSLTPRTRRKNAQLQYAARTFVVKEGENTFDLRLP